MGGDQGGMTTAAQSPFSAAVRDRLWLAAADVGVHDTDARLWLHLADRRVLAFRLSSASIGDDAVVAPLAEAVKDDLRGTLLEIPHPTFGCAIPLYAAPAAPMPRCAYGHPRHKAARAFAAALDQDVLQLLARLDAQRFWSSARNYNRLVLPGEAGPRRMQAVARFPPLAAPIVLTAHHYPEFEGGKRHAWRNHDGAVIGAIERGRDLAGALAAHYGISKGLVRAPVCGETWGDACIAHTRLLHLLDGIPAQWRPATWNEIARVAACLPALERLTGDTVSMQGAFRGCWKTVWHVCETRFAPLAHALDDAGDFLRAAADRAGEIRPQTIDASALGRAWLAARGLVSLLETSRRWHRTPRRPIISGDLAPERVPALLGSFSSAGRSARELACFEDLVQEGSDMHHCVADYWEDSVESGTRIFALGLAGGERATAEYVCTPRGTHDLTFRLEQLRGPCNAEVSTAMSRYARALESILNRPASYAARLAVRVCMEAGPAARPPSRPAATLDPESERQLGLVLAHPCRSGFDRQGAYPAISGLITRCTTFTPTGASHA